MELLAKPVSAGRWGRRKILMPSLTACRSPPIRPRFLKWTPEGFEPGDERGFRDVAALRTDGQGPAGGPQGKPLQYQDQAPVPAEPVQRHLHFRCAGTERAVAGFDQCDQISRSSRRLRCVHDQGQGGGTLAPGARAEAPDREEDGSGSTGGEGGLKSSSKRV